jgi:hypothetical protein
VLAELSIDVAEMGNATLSGDFDEARFRISLILAKTRQRGLLSATEAAENVALLLSRAVTSLPIGYGHAMLRLAKLLTP